MEEMSLWTQIRDRIDSSALGEFFQETSPVASDAAEHLAALLLLKKDEEAWGRLSRDGETAEILESPEVRRLLNDKEVLKMIAFGDHASLLSMDKIGRASEAPLLASRLEEFDADQAAEEILYTEVPQTGGGTRKYRRRRGWRPGGPSRN
jgi:hypothetical protein